MAGVRNVIAASKLKMIELRVWNEFCVSPNDGKINEYISRQKIGSRPSRIASRFRAKLEVNCLEMSENMMLNVVAEPNAVNGMCIAGFIFGIAVLNLRYSWPSSLNLSTRAAICAEDSINRSRVRRSTVERQTENKFSYGQLRILKTYDNTSVDSPALDTEIQYC